MIEFDEFAIFFGCGFATSKKNWGRDGRALPCTHNADREGSRRRQEGDRTQTGRRVGAALVNQD
jgi:hypothetical protein